MGDERTASSVDRKLGERVRARRLEIGMSQETLAERLGVTFQQVQKYEKGINRIAASRLWDIAAAVELPLTRFFEGMPRPGHRLAAGESDATAALATPGAAELVQLYASIRSPKIRRRVLELVRAMDEIKD